MVVLIGKSSTNGPFSMAMLNNQMVLDQNAVDQTPARRVQSNAWVTEDIGTHSPPPLCWNCIVLFLCRKSIDLILEKKHYTLFEVKTHQKVSPRNINTLTFQRVHIVSHLHLPLAVSHPSLRTRASSRRLRWISLFSLSSFTWVAMRISQFH